MKKAYTDIIARLFDAMEKPTEWRKPWSETAGDNARAVPTIPRAEAVLNAYYKRERIPFIEKKQDRSFYSPADDFIMLPTREQFTDTRAYYAVKCHETIHSTGDYTRCNRALFDEYKSFTFGDSRYSLEELVAELGALFLMYELGIDTTEAEKNAGAYFGHWLEKLHNNTRLLRRAGAYAEEAVEYIFETIGKEL